MREVEAAILGMVCEPLQSNLPDSQASHKALQHVPRPWQVR